jgi:hypothetical protein
MFFDLVFVIGILQHAEAESVIRAFEDDWTTIASVFSFFSNILTIYIYGASLVKLDFPSRTVGENAMQASS